VLDNGTEELLVSHKGITNAFRYGVCEDDASMMDWQPMGLVDVFRPIAKLKDSVGRIF
jgi:hypothetical protein